MLRIAVIVPTLDEEAALGDNLPAALALADELIVSDGGSRDHTLEVARARGAKVVVGSPGRGPQLARGAAAAEAEVLLFLHADSRLPVTAREQILAAVAAGAVGGGFAVQFDDPRWLLRLTAWLVNHRTRRLRLPLGDQGQFATREAYTRLGGFKDWPIFEDVDFVRRLRRLGPFAVLPGPCTTSARRFEHRGTLLALARNALLWALYLLGVSPRTLARLYRQER